MTPEKARLTGALVGLARALDGYPAPDDTNLLVCRALRAAAPESDTSPAGLEQLYIDVTEAKFRESPNCRYCASPCGRTSDCDMEEIAEEEAADAKYRLIDALFPYANRRTPDESALSTIYEALRAIGQNLTRESLDALCARLAQK